MGRIGAEFAGALHSPRHQPREVKFGMRSCLRSDGECWPERHKRRGRHTRLPWVFLVALAVVAGCEPVGPVPGGALDGTTAAIPDGWDEARDAALFQLQTRPDDPYSVNLWGVVVDGHLYVASGEGASSRWVGHLANDDSVRLRLGEAIYDLRAVRVADAGELEGVRLSYIEKYQIEDDPDMEGEFGEHAWVFRLDPP